MVDLKCTADFCIIPIGTPTASLSQYIAEVQVMIRSSGLTYSMHSAGTTVEGPWDEVTELIGKAHQVLHDLGIPRAQSDIRIGTRIDKKQSFPEKVAVVEKILEEKKKQQASETKSVV
ncbi:YkoF-like protein [Lipomyces japonicus]|uniref:YkoF-like protein n=1 Tax=Lipomyces japonicus TaxID=56871 RepID=UPI0034CD292A